MVTLGLDRWGDPTGETGDPILTREGGDFLALLPLENIKSQTRYEICLNTGILLQNV